MITPIYIYNITFNKNKITIEFNSLTDIYIILNILDFYKKNKYCIIQKILLISNKLNIKWYNDITIFTKKPLIFLILKMREEWTDNSISDSHINFFEANCHFSIEIFTINEENIEPILLDKNIFRKLLVEEILKDI